MAAKAGEEWGRPSGGWGQRWWNRVCSGSVNGRVLVGAVTVGSWTLVARLAMMGQDLALAYRFGIGDTLDAFVMASAIPGVTVTVLASALESAVVPAYIRVREAGNHDLKQWIGTLTGWAALGLATITAVLAMALPQLVASMAPRFGDEKIRLTLTLAVAMAPMVFLRGLGFAGRALLNAEERFRTAALAAAIGPLAVLAVLAAGFGVEAAAWAVVAGAALEAGWVALSLRRLGMLAAPRWRPIRPLAPLAGQYVATLGGSMLMAATAVVDQITAARLEPGSVSLLMTAGRIPLVLSAVPALALATAAAPRFSRLVSAGDRRLARQTLETYTRWIWRAGVPAVVALVALSPKLAILVFARGAVQSDQALAMARVQACYFLQMPFYVAGVLGARLLAALMLNQALVWIAVGGLLAKVILNQLLGWWMGLAGLALATSLVYLVTWAAIRGTLRRQRWGE